MSSSLNKATIIGNLGKEPEINYTKEGTPIANFSIATSERWRDKTTGEMTEGKTEWHRISVFGRLAEIAQEFLKTGSKVYVEGKIQTNEKDGKYYTSIIANQMIMLDKKSDSVSSSSSGSGSAPKQDEDKPEEGIPF